MKIAVIIIRVLMGLMFTFASIVVLFKLIPQPEQTGNVKIFMDGMTVTGYMMTTVKIIELICAIAFLSGRFVPLATVVIFPITFNILMFHIFLAPEGLLVSILLMIGNLFLAWNYRENYKSILAVS
jgi:putative oxidoreductase